VNEGLLAELAETSKKVRAAVPDARPLSVARCCTGPACSETTGRRSCARLRGARAGGTRGLRCDSLARGRKARRHADRARGAHEIPARLDSTEAARGDAAYEEKLAARLREVLGGTDEERIRQEIALYGVKADVAEELNRLGAHLEEVHRVVRAGGPVGKRWTS